VPLLLLSAAEGHAWVGSIKIPFLCDLEPHVRLLLAQPLLILAELIVNERMRLLVGPFLIRTLIGDAAQLCETRRFAMSLQMLPMTFAHALIRNTLVMLFTLVALPVFAQGTQSLAREAKNPFADLINLQLFYDANLRVGAANETQQVLIIQPLIPFELNTDWTLITRTILPLIAQPGPAPGEAWIRGLADTQFAAFLSPAQAGSLVWGIGPVFQFPSASNAALGQGKWGAGPGAGVQWSCSQWTLGALILNVWSFAGDAHRPAVNEMQVQPTVNYTFRDNPNRYLSFSPTITANWEATGDERWTVPISLGLGQLLKFGHQSATLQVTTYYNVVTPPGSARWTLELLVQFLFPQ
jgi:hypothetical protein